MHGSLFYPQLGALWPTYLFHGPSTTRQSLVLSRKASQRETLRTILKLLRRSIFEACIIPILLYGRETWLLDATSIMMVESFQCEIGYQQLVHSIDDYSELVTVLSSEKVAGLYHYS